MIFVDTTKQNIPEKLVFSMPRPLNDFDLKPIPKWDFYKAVITNDHILTIQTGDTERFTNMILSIGVRMDDH